MSSPSKPTGSGAIGSAPTNKQGGGPDINELRDKVLDAVDWGRSGISDSGAAAKDALAEDMKRLQADLVTIKETLGKLMSESSGEVSKAARKVGVAVGSHAGAAVSSFAEAGADMATSATEQAKTFASELETMALKQPLAALAGALVVGVLIGLIPRGRS